MISRNWRSILILITIITDVTVIIVSGIITYLIRQLLPYLRTYSPVVFIQITAFYCVMLIGIALVLGLYRTVQHSDINRHYLLAGKAYVVFVFFLLSFIYMFREHNIPQRFIVIFFFLLPFVFSIARIFLNKFVLHMRRYGYGNHNVLLAGYDDGGLSIIKRFKSFPELGYDIKGIITKHKNEVYVPVKIHDTFVQRYSISEVEQIISENQIDRVFVPSSEPLTDGYFDILRICRKKNIKLKILSEYSDSLLKLSHVYDIAGIPVVSPERWHVDAVKKTIKRLFDIILSLIALVLLGPIFLIVAICILIEDGRPVLFYQPRALVQGKNKFNIIKFRSMNKNAELEKKSLYAFNEVPGGLFKVKNDPRLTRVGKIIRKLSIDETPQFINVLAGNMSIVGPRPLPIADFDRIGQEDQMHGLYSLRSQGKPGITGLWQISGRRNVTFREMVFLDLYYLENQSPLFDLEIIFATVPVVLFGKGAY